MIKRSETKNTINWKENVKREIRNESTEKRANQFHFYTISAAAKSGKISVYFSLFF